MRSSDKEGSNRVNVEKNNMILNHPVRRINPIYPDHAKFLKIEGKVTVVYNVSITGGGVVKNIRIVYSAPSKIFDSSVRLAMSRWIYERYKLMNDLIVTFNFNFQAGDKK